MRCLYTYHIMVVKNIKNLTSKQASKRIQTDFFKSALVNTLGILIKSKPGPDEAFEDLFKDVQLQKVYRDGKTFVDLVPKSKASSIKKQYLLEKQSPNFDLQEFMGRNFYTDQKQSVVFKSNKKLKPREHIQTLWNVLERKNRLDKGSLFALPHKYIVPGGRFSEQYYWDSYFTMLGLAADDRWDLVESMTKNCSYMIRKFGFIPNANRTYLLSRSQPPFFSHMIKLLAHHNTRSLTMIEYLPYMLSEYRFWIRGHKELDNVTNRAAYRLVRMRDGSLLGRYFDNKQTPRPESLREDVQTSQSSKDASSSKIYLDIRAGAESGWDFSSRWFRDPSEISSIHTTDIVPVDLNCLLYHLEITIAETYHLMRQPILEKRFMRLANRRKNAVRKYLWDENEKFFIDYDFVTQQRTGRLTLAAVFPLLVKIATPAQAKAVASRIEKDFLKTGGLVTTLLETGQQWDSPNGWAPLQWVAIQGLREYGYHGLADRIKSSWIKTCVDNYELSGKLVEKYNVVNPTKLGGGGEYKLQDGFGWTNGVLSALLAENEISGARGGT